MAADLIHLHKTIDRALRLDRAALVLDAIDRLQFVFKATKHTPKPDPALEVEVKFRRHLRPGQQALRDQYLEDLQMEEMAAARFQSQRAHSEHISEQVNRINTDEAQARIERVWNDQFFEGYNEGGLWAGDLLTRGQVTDFELRDENILGAIRDRARSGAQDFDIHTRLGIRSWLEQEMWEKGANPLEAKDFLRQKGFDDITGWRIDRIARTEAVVATEMGKNDTYSKSGVEFMEWIASADGLTRPSHVEMDGVQIKVGDIFPNGLRYPGDPMGPPEEVINCRCSSAPVAEDRLDPQKVWTGWDDPRRGDVVPEAAGVGGLLSHTMENGGATWDPETGEYKQSGFAVGGVQGTYAECDVGDRACFQQAVERLRQDPNHLGANIGTWVDGDKIHIDPSFVYEDRFQAVQGAIERGQLAYFDLDAGEDQKLSFAIPSSQWAPGWDQWVESGDATLALHGDFNDQHFEGKLHNITGDFSADAKIAINNDLRDRIADNIKAMNNLRDHTMLIPLEGEQFDGLGNPVDLEERMRLNEIRLRTNFEGEVRNYIDKWASTSGDEDAEALALQKLAQEKFGLDSANLFARVDPDWIPTSVNFPDQYKTLRMEVDQKLEERRDLWGGLLDAEYNKTQEFLQERNVEYLHLSRGMTLPRSMVEEMVGGAGIGEGTAGISQMEAQPLSSWSTDANIARQFAGGHDSYMDDDKVGVVLEAIIPREQVVSTALTGRGCLSESEVIVMDTPGQVSWKVVQDPKRFTTEMMHAAGYSDDEIAQMSKVPSVEELIEAGYSPEAAEMKHTEALMNQS